MYYDARVFESLDVVKTQTLTQPQVNFTLGWPGMEITLHTKTPPTAPPPTKS